MAKKNRLSTMSAQDAAAYLRKAKKKSKPASYFPCGALVLVDGRHEARVAQAFPEGSSSFLFPHYKVHFVDGDQNVAVAMNRVGVDLKPRAKMCLEGGHCVISPDLEGDGTASCEKCGRLPNQS